MKQACPVIMLFALAACGSNAATPNSFCPNVAVLEEANSLTQYEPGQRSVAAQITEAHITGVTGTCVLLPKRGLVRVTFQVGVSATNGPANHGASISLPYFVSQSTGDIIARKTLYQISVTFDGNVSTASAISEPVTVELPNTPDTAQTDILVAFQLSQDQLTGLADSPRSY